MTTPQEMAKVLRDYADAFEEQFCCKLPPRRYIGDPADCAAPEMRKAAEMLEQLAEEKK